jgi:hypothetical protein
MVAMRQFVSSKSPPLLHSTFVKEIAEPDVAFEELAVDTF